MNKSKPLIADARVRQVVSAAAAGLALGTVVYFILFCLRFYFNSDYADSLIWTQATAEGGAILNGDYTYACLLPFGGSWVFLPFYWMFGMSMTTEICGMILFLLLFSAALLFLCRSLKWSWCWSTLTLAVLLGVLCSTVKLREIFFGHIIYYSLGALFWFVGLGLLLRIEDCLTNGASAKKETCLLILTAVWFMLCATNRTQAFVTFLVPVLAAELLLLPAAPKGASPLSFERIRWIRGLLVPALTAGLGYLLGTLLTQGFVAGYADAFSTFSTSGEWREHALNLLPSWIELVSGHTVKSAMSLTSGEGIVNVIRIAASLLLLALPALAWFFFPKFDRGEKRLLIVHWVLTGLVSFAFIFGLLYNANWRLSPIVVTATITSIAFIRFLWRQYRPHRIAALLLAAVIAFAGIGLACTLNLDTSPDRSSHETRLSAYLEEQGFTYGYATFWNAAAATVLTDSRVKVRSVEITGGEVVPYIYNASGKWYEGQGDGENYFLLLSDSEFAELSDEAKNRLESASNVARWEGFWVFRLPDDLFPAS